MASKSTGTLLIALLILITFPVWIGLVAGAFGLAAGIFGAIAGIIGAVFGAVFGAIGGVLHVPFALWSHGPFHGHLFTILLLILIIALVVRQSRVRRGN